MMSIYRTIFYYRHGEMLMHRNACFTGPWPIDPLHKPRVINADLAAIYGSAIADIKKDGTLRRRCRHQPVQYLNNILEQDHRAVKRRVNAKQGFVNSRPHGEPQGYEAIHMLRKVKSNDWMGRMSDCQNRFIEQLFELAT